MWFDSQEKMRVAVGNWRSFKQILSQKVLLSLSGYSVVKKSAIVEFVFILEIIDLANFDSKHYRSQKEDCWYIVNCFLNPGFLCAGGASHSLLICQRKLFLTPYPA